MKHLKIQLVAAGTVAAGILFATGVAPEWWVERGLAEKSYDHFSENARDDAYSVVNVGQLKNMAAMAKAEMDDKLGGRGGAGAQINELVSGFATYADSAIPEENYYAVNSGQLKAVAKPFFDRISELGNAINLNGIVLYGDTKYPWAPKPSAEGSQLESWYAQQYEAANVGQLKYLFSWYINPSVTPPLPGGADSDGNGIPDWWEQYYFGKLLGNDSQTDFTGYGKTAMEHYQNGTDPTANPDVSLVIHTPLER